MRAREAGTLQRDDGAALRSLDAAAREHGAHFYNILLDRAMRCASERLARAPSAASGVDDVWWPALDRHFPGIRALLRPIPRVPAPDDNEACDSDDGARSLYRPSGDNRKVHLLHAAQRAVNNRRRQSSRVAEDGLVLEFGVDRGTSLRWLAKFFAPTPVHGFDSFEGLPENWGALYPAGTFDNAKRTPRDLPDNTLLHKGWFDDTLAPFLESAQRANPDSFALFLHIDCDLYSSTKGVLSQLARRGMLRRGSVIVFDEFIGPHDPADESGDVRWDGHEMRAWLEVVAEEGLRFEYVSRTCIRVGVEVK